MRRFVKLEPDGINHREGHEKNNRQGSRNETQAETKRGNRYRAPFEKKNMELIGGGERVEE